VKLVISHGSQGAASYPQVKGQSRSPFQQEFEGDFNHEKELQITAVH
jgi:hypothetical protein